MLLPAKSRRNPPGLLPVQNAVKADLDSVPAVPPGGQLQPGISALHPQAGFGPARQLDLDHPVHHQIEKAVPVHRGQLRFPLGLHKLRQLHHQRQKPPALRREGGGAVVESKGLAVLHVGILPHRLGEGGQILHQIIPFPAHLELQLYPPGGQQQHRHQIRLFRLLRRHNPGHLPVRVLPDHGVDFLGGVHRRLPGPFCIVLIIREKGFPVGAHALVGIPLRAGTRVVFHPATLDIQTHIVGLGLVLNQAPHTNLSLPEVVGLHFYDFHEINAPPACRGTSLTCGPAPQSPARRCRLPEPVWRA